MAQSDLSFYTPTRWYDCAVITTTPVDLDDDADVQQETLPDYRNLYLSFATANHGENLSDAYSVTIRIDGDYFRTIELPPIQASDGKSYENLEIGSFSAGSHTLEMTIDNAEETDPSDNVCQRTFAVEDAGRGSYFQTFYGGDTHSLDCSKSVALDYGKYNLSGNFIGTEAGRKVNARVVLCNSHNEALCVINVKNGKFDCSKDLVLTKDTYKVYILSTDNQRTADTVTFSITGEVYYKSDYGDNSIALVSNIDRYAVTTLDAPRTLVSNGWVGLGDTLSLRRIDFTCSGKYTFTVNTTDQLKITLIQVTAGANGQKKEKKLTTKTVNGKKKYGKDVDFGNVLLERGTYYLQAEALKADKGTNADFTVKISSASVFYTDCDNGVNNWLYDSKSKVWNEKLTKSDALSVSRYTASIQIDTDPATVIDHEEGDATYTNFVGFGDAMDIRKVELSTAAKLGFDVDLVGGAGKLILYAVDAKGKLKTVASEAFKTSGATKKTVVLDAGTYYLAMQSTNAKKGDEVYYNVALDGQSVFFTDGDTHANDYDSKKKAVSAEVDAYTANLESGAGLQIDGALDADSAIVIDNEGFTNFVGCGDESDIIKINAVAGDSVSLKITAMDAVTLSVYGLRKGKVASLKSVKLKAAGDATLDYTFQDKDGTAFYVGVESTNAKKGGAGWYNVEVVSFSGASVDALAMPETDALRLTDAPSLGPCCADALADASSFDAVAVLDDVSAWRSLLA